MKLISTTALALGAMIAASPVAAQGYGSRGNVPSQVPTSDGSRGGFGNRGAAPVDEPSQPAPAKVQGQKGISPSPKALKAIVDLQTAVNNKDFANLPAKVAAAQAVATTKEDHYLIGELQLKGSLASGDNAGLRSAIDTIAASGYVSAPEVAQLYLSLGGTYYNNKQFDNAASAFQQGLAIDPNNADMVLDLAEARVAQGQIAQAVSLFQQAIQKQATAGQKPEEALFKRAFSVAYDARLPLAAELGREWAAAYPSADSWRDSIAAYRNLNQTDIEGTLDLLRLMEVTNSLQRPADYQLFVTAAAKIGNYNEAQKALDEGIASKVVDPASTDFRDIVSGLKVKPKATAADLAVAATTAKSSETLLHIGDRYYAMGDYAKAAELDRSAMAKPGADTAEANLHLGMALARAGDKAGAAAALQQVTGAHAAIAKFWLTYLEQRG
jgi:tetratricopeptide (TPR) repeat protein